MLTLRQIEQELVGFNRYMVECECLNTGSPPRPSLVLIDTWWNVNVSVVGSVLSAA